MTKAWVSEAHADALVRHEVEHCVDAEPADEEDGVDGAKVHLRREAVRR